MTKLNRLSIDDVREIFVRWFGADACACDFGPYSARNLAEDLDRIVEVYNALVGEDPDEAYEKASSQLLGIVHGLVSEGGIDALTEEFEVKLGIWPQPTETGEVA